jgi:hypothetical protein
MYAKLLQGATIAQFRDLRGAAVPLKIKIFSSQPVLDKLPSSLQIEIRQGPSNGSCTLCGAMEDAAHIFFGCSLAKFAWNVLRQLSGCNWRPANFAQFHHILFSMAGSPHTLAAFSCTIVGAMA